MSSEAIWYFLIIRLSETIYNLNRSGAKIDPCGTPQVMDAYVHIVTVPFMYDLRRQDNYKMRSEVLGDDTIA